MVVVNHFYKNQRFFNNESRNKNFTSLSGVCNDNTKAISIICNMNNIKVITTKKIKIYFFVTVIV